MYRNVQQNIENAGLVKNRNCNAWEGIEGFFFSQWSSTVTFNLEYIVSIWVRLVHLQWVLNEIKHF